MTGELEAILGGAIEALLEERAHIVRAEIPNGQSVTTWWPFPWDDTQNIELT